MVSNPNYYSQSTTSSFNQIEDGVDFPHTGIIKSLSQGLGQNYAISGFDITFDSATQIDVGAGVIFRDGKRISISAVNNLTLGRTDAGENSYHLVVVDKDNAIVIRSPSAKDKVAPYTERTGSNAHGDTIIAMVTHNGSNPMPVQYLTISKTENSLSLGHNNSGTYAETGTLTASTDGITMTGLFKLDTLPTATIATDDKIILQDTNDSDKIKTATAQSIANLALSTSTATVAADDKVLIKDTNDSDNLKTVTTQSIANLYSEADTLDSVSGRGATTANSISVATITSTANQNISYELVAHPASPVITGTKTVVYIHDMAALGNTVALPTPASGNILYIKNIFTNPITITGTPAINMNDTTHPKITSANVITLAPFEHVTLQAVNDVLAPLITGHMIISD